MAGMTGDQDFLGRPPSDVALTIGEISVLQARIDADLVFILLESQQLVVRKAETPAFLVVGCTVRNPVGVLGDGVQLRLEFAERHRRAHRNAVTHDLQVALLEVYDPPPAGLCNIGISNIPLLRYRPIEHRRPGRNFRYLKRDSLPDGGQRLPNSVTGDAPADRKEVRC